jgi:predicted aspartyl protease
MKIYRTLKIISSKGEMAVKVLFDTGASFTVVRKEVAEKIGHILPTDVKEVTLTDGKTRLKVLGYIPISTVLEGSPIDDIAYVIDELAEDLIIGVKVMEFYDIKLDPSTNKIIVGKNYSSFEFYNTTKKLALKT